MTECGTDAPTEHVLSHEDAVCCLFFNGSSYVLCFVKFYFLFHFAPLNEGSSQVQYFGF